MPDPDYDQNETAVDNLVWVVSFKENFTDAEWTPETRANLLSIQDGQGRTAEIKIEINSGDIFLEGDTDYSVRTLVDLSGHYCLVEVFEPDGTTFIDRWIGTVTADDRKIIGVRDSDSVVSLDQVLTIAGMEQMIDSDPIYGSYVMSSDPSAPSSSVFAIRVDDSIVFNAPQYGTTKHDKNRHADSATAVLSFSPTAVVSGTNYNAAASLGLSAPYAFSTSNTDRDDNHAWNLSDVLNHLVSFYSPKLSSTDASIRFKLDTLENLVVTGTGLASYLIGAEIVSFDAQGKTLMTCLNQLLRPERGLGWKLVYDDDCKAGTAGPIIAIYSINGSASTVGADTLPASTIQGSLILTGRQDVKWTVADSYDRNWGKIVVRGEKILSCFSLSHADGSLQKGWTAQEETAYTDLPGAPSLGDDDGEEKRANIRARSRVWTEYVIKDDWNFKAKNGENSGTPTVVNPHIKEDGTFLEIPSSLMRTNRRFEDFIPIEIEWPTGAVESPEPIYKIPQAFIKWTPEGGTASWYDLVKNKSEGAPIASWSMLNERPGVKANCSPNHYISGVALDNDAFTPSDWQTMIVTVAMRTEECVSYTVDVTGGDPNKKLVIDLPDAELWIIAPNTVYSIDNTQALQRTGASRTIVRDDRPRLQRVAAQAQAWYGMPRRAAILSFDSLTFKVLVDAAVAALEVGRLITTVTETIPSAPINSPIIGRKFDFVEMTSTYLVGDENYTPNFAIGF